MNRKRYSGKYTLSRGKRTRMHTRMRKRKQNGGAGQSEPPNKEVLQGDPEQQSEQLTSMLQKIPPLLAQAEAASKASADALESALKEEKKGWARLKKAITMADHHREYSLIITGWEKFNTLAIRERSKAIAAIEAAQSIEHEAEQLSQQGQFPIEELNLLQIKCMEVKAKGEEAKAYVAVSEKYLGQWRALRDEVASFMGGGRKKTKNPKKKRSKKKKTKKKKRSKSRH